MNYFLSSCNKLSLTSLSLFACLASVEVSASDEIEKLSEPAAATPIVSPGWGNFADIFKYRFERMIERRNIDEVRLKALLGLAPDASRDDIKQRIFWDDRQREIEDSMFGDGTYFTPRQGWKLHVSATPESAPMIKECVEALFNRMQEDGPFSTPKFKVMRHVLRDGDSRISDSQIGKFITIYPETSERAAYLARIIDAELLALNLDPETSYHRPRYEIPLGTSGGLSARYGQFHHGLIDPNFETRALDEPSQYALNAIADKRDSRPWPFFIEAHPFGDLLPQAAWDELIAQYADEQSEWVTGREPVAATKVIAPPVFTPRRPPALNFSGF